MACSVAQRQRNPEGSSSTNCMNGQEMDDQGIDEGEIVVLMFLLVDLGDRRSGLARGGSTRRPTDWLIASVTTNLTTVRLPRRRRFDNDRPSRLSNCRFTSCLVFLHSTRRGRASSLVV
jgi:hypothetical protein